jgi:phosphatidylinositol glycan class U
MVFVFSFVSISLWLLDYALSTGHLSTLPASLHTLTQYYTHIHGRWFQLTDLTPNMGLYWYFGSEIFDPFRTFFLYVIQLHLMSVPFPICIKFRYDPVFCYFFVAGTLSVLRPYPSFADVGFWLGAMLPLQVKLFPCKFKCADRFIIAVDFQQAFVSLTTLFVATLLLPLFWFTWIYAGGNANFYYAVTLVWALGCVLLMYDSLVANLRRTWDIFLFDETSVDYEKECPIDKRREIRHLPVVLR